MRALAVALTVLARGALVLILGVLTIGGEFG